MMIIVTGTAGSDSVAVVSLMPAKGRCRGIKQCASCPHKARAHLQLQLASSHPLLSSLPECRSLARFAIFHRTKGASWLAGPAGLPRCLLLYALSLVSFSDRQTTYPKTKQKKTIDNANPSSKA